MPSPDNGCLVKNAANDEARQVAPAAQRMPDGQQPGHDTIQDGTRGRIRPLWLLQFTAVMPR